eukprot:TRINITY_DN6962_c0_g1_i1.p1 TRINITY_DN6962_c0_g1~~TRINITY_DN6962_c0_g1_i1.p1  ORF type:complete len:419 (+),score=58.92 TRINITY_DN6962_c0_g1_i1:12-1268(+)
MSLHRKIRNYFNYIGDEGLANLAHYSYSGKDNSIIGTYLLPKYFVFIMKICPLWIAPNLLTFIGFMCNLTAYTVIATYHSDKWDGVELNPPGPAWWECVLFSVLLWVYMTLDWIDGKQARRTGTSSPLGELFDHVCDASSLCLFTTSIGAIMVAGPVYTFITLIVALVPFYLAHWEEYYCGELILGYFDNPTEAEVLFMIIGLVSAIGTPHVWTTKLFTINGYVIQLNYFVILLSVLGMISTAGRNILKVVRSKSHRPGVTLPVVFAELIPIVTLVILSVSWVIASPQLLNEYPRLFLMTIGYTFAYLVTRLIVQRICKEQPKLFYPVLVLLYIAVGNSLSKYYWHSEENKANGYPSSGALIPEDIWLKIYFALIMANFLTMCLSLIHQLTNHLNISCFTIPPQNQTRDGEPARLLSS